MGLDLADEEEEGSITRRYLLQDSKINSTLKIGIRMIQTEGDMNFTAPPLKTSMVVGGIAGVLTTEAGALTAPGTGMGEGDDIPSITSKTRELSEAQDIYRRTLAATWACRAGELPPDKLVENLFAGGDGGRPQSSKDNQSQGNPATLGARVRDQSGSSSDERRRNHNQTSDPSSTTPRPNLTNPQPQSSSHLTPAMAATSGHKRGTSRDSPNLHLNLSTLPSPGFAAFNSANGTGEVSGRSSIDQQIQHSQSRRRERTEAQEYTEFDLRDDLRSWRVRVK